MDHGGVDALTISVVFHSGSLAQEERVKTDGSS